MHNIHIKYKFLCWINDSKLYNHIYITNNRTIKMYFGNNFRVIEDDSRNNGFIYVYFICG